MHPWDELDEKNWPEIEDALTTLPLEPPSADLYQSVMEQIKNQETKDKPFVFCSLFDAVMILFAGTMAGLIFIFIHLSALFPEAGLTLQWLYQWMTLPTIFFPLLGAFFMTIFSVLLLMFMFFVFRD